ncbi:MAG: IPT/TIG domain-containing protein [Bacteroidota bacterium]
MILRTLFLFFLLISINKLFAQVPVITSFSPTSGPVGTPVIITGTNFGATVANNIVYFGAVRATVTSATYYTAFSHSTCWRFLSTDLNHQRGLNSLFPGTRSDSLFPAVRLSMKIR